MFIGVRLANLNCNRHHLKHLSIVSVLLYHIIKQNINSYVAASHSKLKSFILIQVDLVF